VGYKRCLLYCSKVLLRLQQQGHVTRIDANRAEEYVTLVDYVGLSGKVVLMAQCACHQQAACFSAAVGLD
jgi:hypothetical protein